MKQTTRKSKLWLLTLLTMLLGGVNSAWADELTENFNSLTVSGTSLSNGWFVQGATLGTQGSTVSNWGSYYYELASRDEDGTSGKSLVAAYGSQTGYVVIPVEVTGTIAFRIAGTKTSNGSYSIHSVTKDGDTYTVNTTALTSGTVTKKSDSRSSFGTWTTVTYSYSGHSMIALMFDKAAIDNFTAEKYEFIEGPALTVKDGGTKIASDYAFSFGLATSGTAHEFILSNPGSEDLTVSVTNTGNFGATLSAATIAAGDEVTLTVTMPDATGIDVVTITPESSSIAPFIINVSGTVRDANKVYEYGFTKLPDDWTSTGSWYYSEANGAYNTSWYLSSNARLITPQLTISEGEMFFVEAKGYSTSNTSYQHLQMQYSADGSEWTNFDAEPSLDPSEWKTFSFTGVPAGKYYIAINASQADVRMFYGGELPKEPKFTFTASDFNFGVITTDKTSSEYTITNNGTATLTGVSVASNNSTFTVSSVPTTIAAGESATFTVTMSAANTGAFNGVITVSAESFDSKTFNVSGAVLPEGASVVDFNDNKLPDGWGNNASNKWSFDDGKAYCTSAAELTSPKLEFVDGDFFVISATSYDDFDNNYLEVTGSADGSDWTAFETKKFVSRSQIPYGSYATLVVTDIPATVKYLKFKGYYVRIDEIAGLKTSSDAPVLGYYTDSECTTAATATVTKDFGFAAEAPDAQVYYIKNDGTGTMSIALGDVPSGFDATLGVNSLAAGASTTLTINMPTETKGFRTGDIVVTAKNSSDEEIGTFTVTATGVIIDADKSDVNFATSDAAIPAGWTANNWTLTAGDNGYIYSGSNSNELVTTTMTAAVGGEKLVVSASGDKNSWDAAAELKVYAKTGENEWTEVADLTSNLLSTSAWYTLGVDIPEGDNLIKFEGKNVYIQRIYGLTAMAVPVMTTTAANMAFGMLTEESAEQTFTISNEGKAELTGLSLTLSKTGDEAEYSVRMTDSEDAEFTGTTLAAGQTINVYVKQLFNETYGVKSDVLTIAADGQTTVTVNLTGTTRNPSLLYVDFDSPNAFPEGWQVGADWAVSTTGTDRYAYQGNSNTASALVTTPLTVAEGQTLSFKVARNNSGQGYVTSLKTRYSQDGGVNWSEYVENYSNDDAGSVYTTIELSELPTGDFIFEFFGSNIKLDMIQGLTLATAPALALTENGAVVANGDTKDFGNLSTDGVATYTLKNAGNTTMTSTITGEGVTVSPANVTLEAGQTADITVTMTYAAPFGTKNGTMTIKTEGWVGDMTVNFTANAVDPTDFLVDFSDNTKPAGWYSESWTYNTGAARIYTGVAKPMITEKVEAATGKNILSFDAIVASGSDEQTLNVYTSADRKKWSEAQTYTLTAENQTFSLDELADGYYYVKFEATNAIVDNIKGVKKVALPEHDLYVSASQLPEEKIFIDTEFSATATVNNLGSAAETGVTAKLFVNNDVVATAAAADVAADGSNTFTMNYKFDTAGDYSAYIEVYYNDGNVATSTLLSEFKVEDYPDLVLDETIAPELTAGTYNITLKRKFAAGWNTVCLPFDVEVSTINENAVAYSFDDYNSETAELTFNKVTSLTARMPYVIYVPTETTELTFKKISIGMLSVTPSASSHGGITFQGSYATVDFSGMDGTFSGITTAGKIAKASASATMKGFRGYFTGIPANARMKFIGDDVATGIRTMTFDTMTSEGIFNLQGQKVEQLNRGGLYIINGKKTIVK